MSDTNNPPNAYCDCSSFEEGEWVECKLNPSLFGVVISESDFGRYYHVQLAGSLETRSFHWATIRHIDRGDGPVSRQEGDDNVIDFTKERELRKTTTTRGAA